MSGAVSAVELDWQLIHLPGDDESRCLGTRGGWKAERVALSGDLSDYPLAELLFFLSSRGRSGWLTLRNDDLEVTFTLRHGRLIAGESQDTRQRLGQLLMSSGLLTTNQLQHALTMQHQLRPKPTFGEVLVELGYADHGEIRRTLKSQISELLFQILIRPGGTFAFTRGLPDRRGITVDVVVEHEVLQAIRRADEWFHGQIQSSPVRIAPQVTPDMIEEHVATDWPILEALLDDATLLDEIVAASGWTREAVIESLMRLQAAGVISIDSGVRQPLLALVGDD
jgi:hypothetical protein